MRFITLPYDYARCMLEDCPLEKTCMRKTPGSPFMQTMFYPASSTDCLSYIPMESLDDER